MKVQQEAQFHIYPRPRNEGDFLQEKKAAKQADETQAAVAKCHCKSKIATGKSWSTTIKQPLWQQTQQVQDEHRRWSPQFASAALVLSSWLAAVSASVVGAEKGGFSYHCQGKTIVLFSASIIRWTDTNVQYSSTFHFKKNLGKTAAVFNAALTNPSLQLFPTQTVK